MDSLKISVVIPCYKVKPNILDVIKSIGPEVHKIYVVDDFCPDNSGQHVLDFIDDKRVSVLFHSENLGVGGAVMTGYMSAIKDGSSIIVKIDGDGQMNPSLIPDFVSPILNGKADYTKGNRFFNIEDVVTMPPIRILGNVLLSFVSKLSSGYWDIFDPTNGFTAIHSSVAKVLPFNKISKRYFFESDMLFRLNTFRAVVVDIPMSAKYGDEVSNLKISKVMGDFLYKHLRNFFKRIFYNYYLRDMSLASIELPVGFMMLLFGFVYGLYSWIYAASTNTPTPGGTIMLSALPILFGLQLVLAFFAQDMASNSKIPVHLLLNNSSFFEKENNAV